MICTCPLCNRRIAASLPLFGTVQKCLGCGAKIRIPGEEGGPAELVEKWLGNEGGAIPRPKEPAAAWSPMVDATGAGPAVALPNVPASAIPVAPPAPEYRRPSPADPLPPAPLPAPTSSSTTAELATRGDTEAITRPVPTRGRTFFQNRAAVAGSLVVAGIVTAIIIVRIVAANRPKADPVQGAALKFNDALAEADAGVHASCTGFVQSVERWLDGQALEPAAIRRFHDAAKRDAEAYAANVGTMEVPDSDEARVFHRKALDLAEAYKDLANVVFAEVVRRIGEGGSPGPADFDRVELLVAHGDAKIQAGQKALVEAQQSFAKKHVILLAPKNQGTSR
ncbi:MAG: hypothetical protein FD180_1136 [Planctomycetota bacterium]|nr:MAG: hypothetical protein FD180_1136 [Planctomycetota bacterium]